MNSKNKTSNKYLNDLFRDPSNFPESLSDLNRLKLMLVCLCEDAKSFDAYQASLVVREIDRHFWHIHSATLNLCIAVKEKSTDEELIEIADNALSSISSVNNAIWFSLDNIAIDTLQSVQLKKPKPNGFYFDK